MRTVVFGGGSSLDNFIARKDHSVDWLYWSDDVAAITQAMWPRFDTVVMGRKTYEAAAAMGTPSYPGVANYVFSRTLSPKSHEGVQIISDDAADFVRRLKSDSGKDICVMGGGELANALMAADLIDEVGLNIHPILLGQGIPVFTS